MTRVTFPYVYPVKGTYKGREKRVVRQGWSTGDVPEVSASDMVLVAAWAETRDVRGDAVSVLQTCFVREGDFYVSLLEEYHAAIPQHVFAGSQNRGDFEIRFDVIAAAMKLPHHTDVYAILEDVVMGRRPTRGNFRGKLDVEAVSREGNAKRDCDALLESLILVDGYFFQRVEEPKIGVLVDTGFDENYVGSGIAYGFPDEFDPGTLMRFRPESRRFYFGIGEFAEATRFMEGFGYRVDGEVDGMFVSRPDLLRFDGRRYRTRAFVGAVVKATIGDVGDYGSEAAEAWAKLPGLMKAAPDEWDMVKALGAVADFARACPSADRDLLFAHCLDVLRSVGLAPPPEGDGLLAA